MIGSIIRIPAGTRPTSDKMADFLAELQHATSLTEERQRGFYIGIHTNDLRRLLGGNYAKIVQEAINLGYIERNPVYSAGAFPMSYRLVKPYLRPETALHRLGRITTAPSRIRLRPDDVAGQELAKCFDCLSVSPDEAAKATGWAKYSMQCVLDGMIYATRCEYGRLHTTFTGMPRSVRRTLRIDGQSVVDIDVANCQPLIVGLLTGRHSRNDLPSDLQQYLELCSSGTLYECLLELCHQREISLWDCIPEEIRHPYGEDREMRRSDIKEQFLVMLFAENETAMRMALFELMAEQFPTVAAYIRDAKQTDHRELARACQRFESSLMIDGVAAKLAAQTPVLTIHDAIIVARKDADTVADAIRQAFAAKGVNVTVKQGA